MVETARFPANPHTMRPGDLLGPFDGVVVDGETDRPIAGASVEGSWACERGIGLTGPIYSKTFSMETSADGRYQVPRVEDLPSGNSTRLVRFSLIVFKRGYVGYRSDFKFPSGEVRHDFSQRQNKVRLVKWDSDLSPHRHRRFIGGGDSIRKATEFLGQPAAMELEGKRVALGAVEEAKPGAAIVPENRLLDASLLLSEQELRGVTGFGGEFTVTRLPDRVRTESYDSQHFKAEGKNESFDMAFRVWRLSPADAEEQFVKLSAELPAAKTTDEIGDRSLRARGGEVLGLAFLTKDRGLVVQVSCGTSQCTDSSMVLRVAKMIESHFPDLSPAEPNPSKPKVNTEGGAP